MAEALAADEASARATAERFESWVAGPLSGTSGAALVAELTEAPAFFSPPLGPGTSSASG